MRLVIGSEVLLKEQQCAPPVDDSTSSFFTMNPFRDFASRKFREMLKKENMDQLIQWREEVLEDRL